MDIHSALTLLDYVVIAVYALFLVGIGFFVSYRQRGNDDLFLADRSLHWSNVGLSIFGTNIGPTFLIATAGAGYTTGIVTANYEWLAFIFLMILAMVFIPYYLHTNVSTMPEFMKKRFGDDCYTFMSWFVLFSTVVMWIGGTLFAGGALLGQIMQWSLFKSVCVLAVVAASFTVAGGLAAVVITDSFQSVLMILGAGALAVIGFHEVGGIEKLQHLQVGELDPTLTWKLFRPSGSADPWYALVLGYPVLGFWFWCTDQTIVQRALGARNLKQAQFGIMFAAFLKILPPIIFLLPGIMAAALLPGIKDDKLVFVNMVTTYLPSGMVGLIVAVLIAAVISTLDSGLNSFSTIFTLDIYKRKFNPAASPNNTKQVGRIVTVLATVMAVGIAMYMNQAKDTNLFNLFQSIIGFLAPPVAAVFLIGLFWNRATSKAAIWTLAAGFLISITAGMLNLMKVTEITLLGKTILTFKVWPHFLMMSFYMFIGNCLFMIIMSLLTKNAPDEAHFPPLKTAYKEGNSIGLPGWILWGLLIAIMVTLYIIFN
jgi:SSS family solute:Na+ symporter